MIYAAHKGQINQIGQDRPMIYAAHKGQINQIGQDRPMIYAAAVGLSTRFAHANKKNQGIHHYMANAKASAALVENQIT